MSERKVYKVGTDWRAYWNSLTESEQESLRRKARWEHMTLMAVAVEWGAVTAERVAGKEEGNG